MLNPKQYKAQQKARNERALKEGWSLDEINLAYKIRREGLRVNYIDNEVLQIARENIQNAKRN